MKKIIQYLFRALWRFSIIIVFVGGVLYFGLEDFCSDTILSEINSPNKIKKAIIFERDCGATTEAVFHVAITESNNEKDLEKDIICSIRPKKGHFKKNDKSGKFLQVNWVSDDLIEILLKDNTEIIKTTGSFESVAVVYKK